jgi:selenocysteine-specific elongation factor
MTERAGAAAPGAPEQAGPSVVATAGHVDHGKSSLVMRLTGMDPDRLDEEKRRGLTIELGYAWCTLPSGRELGFVDVPGHERFVRTMLAGVGPVPLVLFVVAADEGWRPQSEEHLEIVDVLGTHGAVIALTKRDLVEAAGLDRVRAEVTDRVRATALEGAPIVACSSTTGEGFDELVAALDAMLADAPEPDRGGRPRLHVDRVFSIRGSGTVVTGTLTGGPIATGEEVELLPSGTRARIRGLQTHHRGVGTASPVSRVAVNLTADRTRIARGEVLAPAGVWTATSVLEARIEPVRSLDHPITSRGAFKLHAGAAERNARIRLYDVRQVSPEGAFVRISLSEPLVLDVGDRFVFASRGGAERSPAASSSTPTRRFARGRPRHSVWERVCGRRAPSCRRSWSPNGGPCGATTSGRSWHNARRRRGRRSPGRVVGPAGPVGPDRRGDRGAARRVPRRGTRRGGESIATTRRSIADAFAAAGAPHDLELADAVVDRLESEGTLIREGALVRLASHRAGSDDEVAGGGGGRSERRAHTAVDRRAPRGRCRHRRRGSGRAVRAPWSGSRPELVLTRELVERAGAIVREAVPDGITLSAFREGLGTSRKYAVPLAEHLDRSGVTRRSGDLRFARGATGASSRSSAQPS